MVGLGCEVVGVNGLVGMDGVVGVVRTVRVQIRKCHLEKEEEEEETK